MKVASGLEHPQTTVLNIGCRDGGCIVEFEPVGNTLTVKEDDFLLVEIMSSNPTHLEITYTGPGLSIWLDSDWVRVTNKAGEVLIEPR